jgi:hypothetical protein
MLYSTSFLFGSRTFFSPLSAELVASSYYYLFYRFLFARVENAYLFGGFQLVHLLSEWIIFPLRTTQWYFNVLDRICSAFNLGLRARRLLCAAPFVMSVDDTSCFVCLDFALKTAIAISNSITFTLLLSFGRLGYNSQHYCFGNLSDDQFRLTLVYTGISIVLEVLSVLLMEFLFWRPRHLSMLHRLFLLYENKRFFYWTALMLAGILSTALSSRLIVSQIQL